MSDVDSTETAVEPQGKPLSLRRAGINVVGMAVSVILAAALGIHGILIGEKLLALVGCFVAMLWLLALSGHVYTFLQVKKGVAVASTPMFSSLAF